MLETYWSVAFKAGQGNKTMRYVTGGGTVLGPTLLAIGIVSALNEVSTAAPDQKPTVAAREVYGMLFGATGASLGSSLGAGAAVATGVALGITPPGWLVIGLALIGSALVGYWGTKAGRELVGPGSDGGT